MAPPRALSVLLLASVVWLASCSTPPPPRVVSRVAPRVNTALLITSDDGQLTAQQLEAKRGEIVRYLTERSLLLPGDVLLSDAAAADRIIRVSVAAGGGFKVTVFNPGNVGTAYSAPAGDSAAYSAAPPASRYDPFFDFGYSYNPWPEFGYYPYRPRNDLRPHYPPDYLKPVEPRRPPPPPVVVTPVPPPPIRPHRPHDRDHRPGEPVPPRRPDAQGRSHDGVPDTRDRGDRPRPHSPQPPSSPPRPETHVPVPPPPPRPAPTPPPAPERNRDKDDPRNNTSDRER